MAGDYRAGGRPSYLPEVQHGCRVSAVLERSLGSGRTGEK